MNQITFKQLHSILLDMAEVFHQICTKHKIPYYMLGGTMLGAIRHHGIIPWDDDMDFGIPRIYEDRIIKILKNELPSKYRLLTYRNDPLCTDCIKIELPQSKLIQDDGTEAQWGINIDIFMLDYADNNRSILSRNFLSHLLIKYNVYAFSPNNKKRLAKFIRMINIFPKSFALSIVKKISLLCKKNHSCFANHAGFWGMKEIVEKKIFGQPTLYLFQDHYFYGVENPHEYLTQLYGDYMQLPPIEKRHSHCKQVLLSTKRDDIRNE